MNEAPKISVGIVVYNGVEHIRNALESVVNQSYQNIELIVVDGKSTDGTVDVLNEYAKHISILVSESDNGIYDAMNKLRNLATGDWLLFLGCDDRLLDVLQDVAQELVEHDSLYYGNITLRSTGATYGGIFTKQRLACTNFSHQSLFYPKSIYKKYAYNENYKLLSDYDYNIRLVGDGVQFHYLDRIVALYNDEGRSMQGDPDFEKDKLALIRKSLGITTMIIEVLRRIYIRKFLPALGMVLSLAGRLLRWTLPHSWWQRIDSWKRRLLKL